MAYNNNNNYNNNRRYQSSGKKPNNNRGGSRPGGGNYSPPNKKVFAPYNFAPFSDTVLTRYDSPADLPRHDTLDPALRSGEIHITVTAETPVCVRGGDNQRFFRTPDGKYAIPGSTLRGLIRENMQILGLGLVRTGEDLDDERILFRNMANSSRKSEKNYYRDFMRDHKEEIRAGYIYKKGKNYYIAECLGGGRYYRISRAYENEEIFRKLKKNSAEWEMAQTRRKAGIGRFQLDRNSGFYNELMGTNKQISVYYGLDEYGRPDRLSETSGQAADMQKGAVLLTGRPVNQTLKDSELQNIRGLDGSTIPLDKNSAYLFPEADMSTEYLLSEDDVLFYQTDFERRANVLGRNKDFYRLPKKDEMKAVFFIRYKDPEREEAERTYFGRSLYLRIGLPKTIGEGLPSAHKRLAGNKDTVVLDYPHAMLGFAQKKGAYKSRVSFGDLPAEAGAKPMPAQAMILGGPKPSFGPGYVTGSSGSYIGDFRLRGYKQYWLKKDGRPVAMNNDRVDSRLEPLPARTRFSGVIRYKNLQEDELGLLLWSLLADGAHYHALGGGKPYGFGRVSLRIDGLYEYDWAALYAPEGLTAPLRRSESAAAYIEAYQAFAAERTSVRPEEREEIRDFLFMKSEVTNDPEEYRYMHLGDREKRIPNEYQNNTGVLRTAASYREEAGRG